jgi:hypothetical protein
MMQSFIARAILILGWMKLGSPTDYESLEWKDQSQTLRRRDLHEEGDNELSDARGPWFERWSYSGAWDDNDGRMDDDFFPMPFGDLPVGAMSAMGALVVNWTSSITYGDLDCPSSDATSGKEPVCAATLKGDVGVWVCRRLVNPFTGESQSITLCADGKQTVGEVDVCGCCGGTCPQVCECPCTTFIGEEGVRVLINSTTMMKESESTEICIDSKLAVSIVGSLKHLVDCVEDCSVPMGRLPPFVMTPGAQMMRFMMMRGGRT